MRRGWVEVEAANLERKVLVLLTRDSADHHGEKNKEFAVPLWPSSEVASRDGGKPCSIQRGKRLPLANQRRKPRMRHEATDIRKCKARRTRARP